MTLSTFLALIVILAVGIVSLYILRPRKRRPVPVVVPEPDSRSHPGSTHDESVLCANEIRIPVVFPLTPMTLQPGETLVNRNQNIGLYLFLPRVFVFPDTGRGIVVESIVIRNGDDRTECLINPVPLPMFQGIEVAMKPILGGGWLEITLVNTGNEPFTFVGLVRGMREVRPRA